MVSVVDLHESENKDGGHAIVVEVVNRLDDEIFLEVTNIGIVYPSVEGAVLRGGVSRVAFPDNTAMIRRLHASTIGKDGSRATCSCGSTRIELPLDPDFDLPGSQGKQARFDLDLTGFRRSDGKKLRATGVVHFQVPK